MSQLSISEPWEGRTGAEIEALIKKELQASVGYFFTTEERLEDGLHHMYGFRNEEDYRSWASNPAENASLILANAPIPEQQSTVASYIVNLALVSPAKIISVDNRVSLKLRFTSIMYSPIDKSTTDTNESGILTVETKLVGQNTWRKAGEVEILSVSSQNADDYQDIDITAMLTEGEQQVRMYVRGGVTDKITTQVQATVVKTQLGLEFAGNWNAANREQMPLSYYINGAVAKTLHISISGKTASGLPATRKLTFAIGTSTYPTTPWSTIIEDSANDTCKILGTHGVHTVEAWLTCEDGNGGQLESAHTHNQLMVVADEHDVKPFIMLQNVAATVQNYVQGKLLDFAVYNPLGNTNVSFVWKNYAGNMEYLRIQQSVPSETAQELINTIEVEDASQASLYAYMHVMRTLPDGSEEDFMLASTGNSSITISVDNTENFTPTPGADFFLNPKTRNNSEANPARILNAAKNNAEIQGAIFDGFGFVNDGWVTDADNNKVLRVRAGQSVVIPYEPFQDFLSSTANSCTIEVDFTVRNITNEADPIFRICNYVAATGKPLGIEMRPLVGRFLTTSKTTDGEQDFRWQEGVRTHIAFNIVHALRSSAADASTLPLVRVFINGVINREFMFDLTEEHEFINGSSLGIRIGQIPGEGRSSAADIDIHSVKVLRKALGAADCQQDYVSSLPTAAAKLAFRQANDILAPDGTISYAKASAKYNCIVFHGVHTSGHSDADKNTKKGWLEIHMLDADGNYDPKHSGTICKETASLPDKGQGSTAKTYREWNQQYDINKAEGKIMVNGEEVGDGWIDGNGVYQGQKYKLIDGVPAAQKLVLKINYASSMQSHKQGGTELYNDLYKAIVGPTSIQQTEGFENTRVAVIERPFLYFTQGDGDSEPVFQGPGTFGPGKMDKKTWGYDKEKFPDFCMLEGSDNNMPLTDMRIPWTDETVTYNPAEEYFEYAGMGNLDFDAGATNKVVEAGQEVEYPKTDTYLPYYKAAWNWLFMHNCQFMPFDGTLSDFLGARGIDTRLQYWMTRTGAGASQYDLYRYNVTGYDEEGNEIGEWVPAGMPEGNGFAVKNLLELFPDAIPAGHAGQWDNINTDFQNAMATAAKAEFGQYFNERSAQFHYAFVNHFLAGTDNNSKNTYYVLDPIKHIIELHQDDLDTIFATDNVGWQDKPYYIDREHDWDMEGNSYYEGKRNVLFDLIERMYRAELPQVLNAVLTAMASLITASDMAKGIEASPAGCMQKYFFSIAEYFPAVAYNEAARIRYEQAQLAVEKGTFTPSRGVMPITQSLGNQLESERQYMKRRLVYMASYAAYGEFSQSGSNALSFQGYPTVNGESCVMRFNITPHQWLYPTGSRGQTLIDPHVRVAPGEVYTLNLGTVTGDTNVRVAGVNYMRSLGNLGDISVNPNYSFPLSGERLVEFIAEPTGDAQFRPSSMAITAPLLERFSIKGANVGGAINLTGCTRLIEADLRGTGVTTVRLPESERMARAYMPSQLAAVAIDNMPNLNVLTFEGYNYLNSLTIGENVGNLDTLSVLIGCYMSEAPLNTLSLRNINWLDMTAEALTYLISIKNLSLTGQISTRENGNLPTITFDIKKALIEKFGNVDDVESPDYRGLKLNYTVRAITTVGLSGDAYTHDAPKVYPYIVTPGNAYQNGFQKISWSATAPAYGAECSIDPVTGELDVRKLSALSDTITITCSILLTDGTFKEVQKQVGIYDRPAALGDFVFADGTYSDVDDPGKTTVGICCFIGDEGNGDYTPDSQKRLMVALGDVYGTGIDQDGAQVSFQSLQWGLYHNNGTDANNNVPTSTPKYALADSPSYDMYNIQTIEDLTVGGITVSDSNFRDIDQPDGFKRFPSNTVTGDGFHYQGPQPDGQMAAQIKARTLTEELADLAGSGYKLGDVVNSGYAKTLKIIAHRNKILTDSNFDWVGSVPQSYGNTTEMQDLLNGMAEVRRYAQKVMGEAQTAKWSQFFYPAASLCYAYRPAVKPGEELADKFKEHNWFLPTSGQLARLYWYSKKASADENIFTKAKAAGKFIDFAGTNFWSSTEYYQTYAWYVYFTNGGMGNSLKCGTFSVRPLAAF